MFESVFLGGGALAEHASDQKRIARHVDALTITYFQRLFIGEKTPGLDFIVPLLLEGKPALPGPPRNLTRGRRIRFLHLARPSASVRRRAGPGQLLDFRQPGAYGVRIRPLWNQPQILAHLLGRLRELPAYHQDSAQDLPASQEALLTVEPLGLPRAALRRIQVLSIEIGERVQIIRLRIIVGVQTKAASVVSASSTHCLAAACKAASCR